MKYCERTAALRGCFFDVKNSKSEIISPLIQILEIFLAVTV